MNMVVFQAGSCSSLHMEARRFISLARKLFLISINICPLQARSLVTGTVTHLREYVPTERVILWGTKQHIPLGSVLR